MYTAVLHLLCSRFRCE